MKKLTEVDYKAIEALMDDDIREELHAKLAPCTEGEFWKRTKRHTSRSMEKSLSGETC